MKQKIKNTNMITDKLHENDTNLRRRFQSLRESLSNTLSLQANNEAHSSPAILAPNKQNFIANVDSGIDDKLLRELNKDYDPKRSYFEIPNFYLDNYQYLKDAIDELGTLNQRYGRKVKGVKSSEIEKKVSVLKNLEKKVKSY